MEYISIIVGAVFVIYFLWKTLFRRRPLKGKTIPGPIRPPVAGHAFNISLQTLHIDMAKHVHKYGDIMAFDIFGIPIVVLSSMRIVRKALVEDSSHYMSDKPPFFFQRHFFANDESVAFHPRGFSREHSALRKTFMKGIQLHGNGTTEVEATEIAEIRHLLDMIQTFEGKEFELTEVIRTSVTSLVSMFLCGRGLSDNSTVCNTMWRYFDAVLDIVSPMVDVILTAMPFMRFVPGVYRTTYNNLNDNLTLLIDEYFHKAKNNVDNRNPLGIVGFLLAEQEREKDECNAIILTDRRIIGIISDIILGGIVTSFGTITSTILCMMRHPKVMKNVQAEILEVVGKDRLPELADKDKCPYTEAVLMEVLRYISIGPMIPHFCNEHTSLDGYDIPAESVIMINLWHIHHDVNVWGDPWNFRPERFLDDHGQLLPRTNSIRRSWMPFGIGRRQCAGEMFGRSRIFLFIASLLQRWTFIPSADRCGSCDPRSDQFVSKATILPKPFYCRVVENKTEMS